MAVYLDSTVQAQVVALLQRRSLWLSFGGQLEADYIDDHRQRAIKAYQANSLYILLIYTVMSSGIYFFIPKAEFFQWVMLYSGVGLIVVLASTASHISALDKYFDIYVWWGSFLAIAISIIATTYVTDPVTSQLTQAAIIFAVIIIFTLVCMRFSHACYAVVLGGVLGAILTWVVGHTINWGVLHRTYTLSLLLGVYIAYFSEKRDRELYLQTLLFKISRDKTEVHANRMEKLSRQDALTGLANRRSFDNAYLQEWNRAARQGYPVSLLMIDIDHFKHYNDKEGHIQGDSCLRKIASIIAAHARRPGDLAVRYGGEEFLLLLPDMEKMKACQQAERLVQAVQMAKIPQARGLDEEFLGISIGVATATPGETMMELSELVLAADDALYEAKHAGRNGWRYAAGIGEQTRKPESD